MSTPRFVDTAYAADMLHIATEAVLDLVDEGRLRPYGGRPPNYIFRTPDVAALAGEVASGAESEEPRRARSPAGRVQTRITADARWVDITEDDIRAWARRTEEARRRAAEKVVEEAIAKLRAVLQVLRSTETV